MIDNLKKRQNDFLNYTMDRIREALCHFTDKQIEIFFQIPFFLHINSASFPGYIPNKTAPHGICDFENSEFYKEAIRKELIPKSEIQTSVNKKQAILAFYHIGNLGTYTQPLEADFDYWVIINREKFSDQGYEELKKKLNGIVSYSSEYFDQKVSFSIMDHNAILNNSYESFMGRETHTVSKVFLKEKFYRTILMIGGKIPVWSILPHELTAETQTKYDNEIQQILNSSKELIDFGHLYSAPVPDILKGILWNICESKNNPVKSLIDATMMYSHGFGSEKFKQLICEQVKKEYLEANTKNYRVDPYKKLYDHILEFHKKDEPEGLDLIIKAIFFSLCGYPDVILPEENSPKHQLLGQYLRQWGVSKSRMKSLLSFTEWPESEKLKFEDTIVRRLTQMYSIASRKHNSSDHEVEEGEQKNWIILKNKTRERLQKNSLKIQECSSYLKNLKIVSLIIKKIKKTKSEVWSLDIHTGEDEIVHAVHQDDSFLGLFGWIIGNNLYKRQSASIELESDLKLYQSNDNPINLDTLYMHLAPVTPLFEEVFENKPAWSKALVLLVFKKNIIVKAELLFLNSWGELIFDFIEFPAVENIEQVSKRIAMQMHLYSGTNIKHCFFQLSRQRHSEIVYKIKKAYNNLDDSGKKLQESSEHLYLDKL